MKESPLFTVRLPLPPSVNGKMVNPNTGRPISTPELRLFKKDATPLVRAQLRLTPFVDSQRWYAAEYHFWFDDNKQFLASDWDNRVKAAQDVLCKTLGINDNRIRDGRGIRRGVGVMGGCAVVKLFPYVDHQEG